MAGVLDKYLANSQNTESQNAVASSGGVLGMQQGVLDKYVYNKPQESVLDKYTKTEVRDPIFDQWKLEQQLKQKMNEWRAKQKAEAPPAEFVRAEKTAENLRAEKRETQQQTKAARQAWHNAQGDIYAAIKAGNMDDLEELVAVSAEKEKAYKEADPAKELRAAKQENIAKARENLIAERNQLGANVNPATASKEYKAELRAANEAYQQAKAEATDPLNRMVAPERYDPFVQAQGAAKAAWYDQSVLEKGAQAKGNPLHEDARKKLAGGGMGQASAAAEELRAIAALTDDQKAYINYVYGTYDKKLAGQLTATLLQNVLNELNAADPNQTAQNIVTGVSGSIFSGPVYAAEMVGQAVQNLATGANLPVADYTPGSRMMSEQAERTQDLLDDRETEVGKFLTGTGLSVGQNVVNTVLFGKLAPVMMAIQSAGSGGYEAAQNGATGWQQLGKGAQSGVTELLTEKISWGKLEDVLEGMPAKTAKGIIAKIAGQMATEAGEETAGEAVSMLYDWIAMGDAGDLKQTMEAYKAENGDDGAAGYLALQILQRLGESALAGAASGGVLGGWAQVINAVQNRNTGNAEKTNATAVDLPQEAPQAAGNDAAQGQPQSAQSGVERGQENAQGPVADFSESEANQAPVEENTQNAAEKKPPVNRQARSIDAEEVHEEAQYNVERTSINDNEAEHTPEQQQRIEEYKKAVNPKVISLIQKVKNISSEWAARDKADKTAKKKELLSVQVAKTSDRAKAAIRELTGMEDPGQDVFLDQYAIEHIIKRHGEAGKQDKTMRYAEDVSRAGYVLDNFDSAYLLKTTSDRYMTKDNKRAPHVAFVKKLNGSFVVIEAVTDAKKGRCHIASAYITNNVENIDAVKGWSLNEKEAFESDLADTIPTPDSHVQNDHYAASEGSVTQHSGKVNAENAGNVPNTRNVMDSEPQQPSRPENKRSAESRARDAARELHAGKAGEEKILQTIRQMDEANMTPEMRQTVAQTVAKELVKEGPYISKEFWDSFAPLREYLRKTEMHIDPQTLGEIKAMGLSVTGFNQKYGTRLTTKQMKRSLDGNMAEWAALTNGLAQESNGNAFDALVHTLEVMRQGKAGELDAPGYEAAVQGAAETMLKYADETMEPDELETWDKKHGLQSTASQVNEVATESNGPEKPNKSGWEKFKKNRIAQAMQHKPEGAVARMADAETVRKAEEEIAKAKKQLVELKENATKGEIDLAESVAKGNLTLQQVSTDLSKERVALMAEQLRLIKQWEELGLVGQKKRLHKNQFAAAEKILEGADDAIFEHDQEGSDKLISKRKNELFRLLSTTSERVMHRVFDKASAQKAIAEYIRPAERNEAAKIMAIGRIFDGARELKLNRYESAMTQLVGEGLLPAWSKAGKNPLWENGQALVESLPEYARKNPEIQKLAANLDKIDAAKITKAVEWYRKTYDDFHALVNNFRLAHGMPEIGNIEQYFPHFSQDMDGDMLNQTLKAFGIEQMGNLPASIAGMTQGFRPFSRWVGSFQKRTGPQTVFGAEQGLQMYANAVMDMLYHTDDIMRIRHLETMIRQRSKEAAETGKRPGTAERLERMKGLLDDPAQLEKLEEEMEYGEKNTGGKDISSEYSGFVQWLREYGNKLAGKGDTYRLTERVLGRQTANVINKMLGNYGSAQIVGNLRSAIANTTVLPKMLALLETKEGGVSVKPEIYIGQALSKMARGEMADIYGRSEFMTSKQGVDPLVKTPKDKASNALMWFFNVVEDAMSKLAFTAGYVQAQDQLKDSKLDAKELERQVIQKANDFAAQVMSRRDKAGAALLSSSREPIIRLVSMFQTEISNEWQTIRQDLPREFAELEKQVGEKKAKAAYAAAAARYVLYSHVLGQVAELVLGIDPFNDILAWVADFLRDVWEEPEEEDEKGKVNLGAVTDLAGNAAGAFPYINTVAALAGYTNDRLPLFNAKEFVEDVGSVFTAGRASGRLEGIANVAGGVGQFAGIPGTGQAVKTAKGIIALADQGKRSQKTGQLQDVWQWDGGKGAGDFARALAFGPSAMKGMREYYDSGYKAELTKAQTDAYDAAIGADVPKDTALEFVKWSKGVVAEKDKDGDTVPNSKRVQYLEKVNGIEGLTAEQRAILYQGALSSDQAEDFAAATDRAKAYGFDLELWMDFLEGYYKINGTGKKNKVKQLLASMGLTGRRAEMMAKAIGYDIS